MDDDRSLFEERLSESVGNHPVLYNKSCKEFKDKNIKKCLVKVVFQM